MKRQDLFNAMVDIMKKLTEAEKNTYISCDDARKDIQDADSMVRRILGDEFGDWGDMTNPKIEKLWNNYDNRK
jgi:hypothetical protein